MKLEEMSRFFMARVDEYDAHMLGEVEGCREGYEKMAALLPQSVQRLLDLGCGTGLELDKIFSRFPNLQVTGIDMTQAMLDKLKEKYPDKDINLICGNYLTSDFGNETFDCAVSFETMHHLTYEEKIGLYKRIFHSLASNGMYIECDYIAPDEEIEEFTFQENRRIRKELGIPQDAFYHFDTPCTAENQIRLLTQAGFHGVEKVWQRGNTALFVAYKQNRFSNRS